MSGLRGARELMGSVSPSPPPGSPGEASRPPGSRPAVIMSRRRRSIDCSPQPSPAIDQDTTQPVTSPLDELEPARHDPAFSPSPTLLAALQADCEEGDVKDRLHQLHRAFSVFSTHMDSQGDNVKPLAEILCSAASMWKLLHIAHAIKASLQSKQDDTALVIGITACAGAGKSTLVQALKVIITEVLECGRAEEISLDDFLSSQQEREERGIRSRWDINSTNETLAHEILTGLVHSGPNSVITVPRFSKGRDEREGAVSFSLCLVVGFVS